MRLRADHKLFLTYIALITLVLLSVSLGADSFVRARLIEAEQRHLRRELALAAELYETSPPIAPDSFSVLLGSLSGRRVTVIAPDGRVLGESTRPGGDPYGLANHADRPEVRGALESVGSQSVVQRYSMTIAEHHLYAAVATERGDVLRLSVPLAEVDAALRRVQRGILGVGAVALVVAILFSIGFSILITRPLRRIQGIAVAMAGGDLSRRLRSRRGDELGDLARALDALADQLQRRLGQLDAERIEMRTLIDSMSEGVIAITAEGTVRRANPAASGMFGIPLGASELPFEGVTRRPEFLRLVRGALDGATSSVTEFAVDRRTLLGTAHPLPDGGAVLVFLDVSELRRLEGVRRDFVANASHELKTPLTAIRGYSETLLDPDLPPELRQKFAEIVRQNADRLRMIVDDLLDLSRIESGGWRVEPERVDLGDLIAEAWAAQPADADELVFEVEIDPDAEEAQADPAAVRQILTNLLSNAVRYTPAGGRVTITTAPVPEREGWVRLAVSDTGAGIAASHLPRIFERFYRADPARSRAAGGTGLGLAIVRHLVEAHGGTVDARSEIGRGTTVSFTLPRAP